jgi:CheY-like chemotaxis protein
MIEHISKLIEALAAMAWPAIVLILIVCFRPAIVGIIESAKSRRFTLKVGGQELSMEEVNEQQRNLISDLQTQLLDVRKRLDTLAAPAPADSKAVTSREPSPAAILWADDNPKNNSYFVERLTKAGIKVDLARSTGEALSLSSRQKYSSIISDMHRYEDGADNSDAGIDLLKAVRGRHQQTPFIIYCGAEGIRAYGAEAKRLGVTGITSSPTQLSGLLNLDRLEQLS